MSAWGRCVIVLRPKGFKATIACLVGASVAGALGIAFAVSGGSSTIVGLFAILFLAFSATGVTITAIRNEKQNQRVNANIASVIRGLPPKNGAGVSASVNQAATRQLSLLESRVGGISRQLEGFAHRLAPRDMEQKDGQGKASVDGGEAKRVKEHGASAPVHSAAIVDRCGSVVETGIRTEGGEVFHTPFVVTVNTSFSSYDSIQLTQDPVEIALDVADAESVVLNFSLFFDGNVIDYKAGLMSAAVYDQNGHEIEFPTLPSVSEKYGHFTYLGISGDKTDTSIEVTLPFGAAKLVLKFYKWSLQPRLGNRLTGVINGKTREWFENRAPREIRVAAILDEFSYNSFKFECDLVNLSYSNWREEMDRHQPELFFCESAWSGGDSQTRPWKGRIYASKNFPNENRSELLKILEYCKQRRIPTVFWNKEDPSHYDDKVHNFVDTALKFDHIFTTDLASADRYRREHGHSSVGVLPFAVQPRLFNPIERGERSKDVIFAGGWYSNHVQRSLAMEKTFDAVIESGLNLKIYDRFYGSDDPSKEFPERFRRYLNPPIANELMASVYKESETGITINTETNSPTMFARRIFELMACNTFVISNFSNGVYDFFGDNVLYSDLESERFVEKEAEDIERARDENLQLVLSEHTYRKRFEQILRTVGLPFGDSSDLVSLICRVGSLEDARAAHSALRSFGHWPAPKVISLSAEASSLDYSDALMELNTAGISVVYEPLIASGQTPVGQLSGKAGRALVFSLGQAPTPARLQSSLKVMLLHSQYTDVPMVCAGDGEPKYRFGTFDWNRPALVESAQLADFLIDAASSKSTTIYRV